MSQDQIRQLNLLFREFKDAERENIKRKAEIDAGIAMARQQLASARELLAQLDAILNSGDARARRRAGPTSGSVDQEDMEKHGAPIERVPPRRPHP